ncbi:TonB-dependent receptor P26 [Arenibacter antarcticus]
MAHKIIILHLQPIILLKDNLKLNPMKNKLLQIQIIFVLLICGTSIGQNVSISGTVNDLNGDPLPGASVVIEGTSKGVVTDFDGNYSIEIESSELKSNGGPYVYMIASYVGFANSRIEIGNKTVINFKLSEDAESLDEVVVTALGITREKRSLGYATEQVKAEKLGLSAESNVVNLLSGQAAGVQVTGSNNIGGSSSVVIRGVSSLGGNNQPLFVIDGTPMINNNINSLNTQQGTRGRDYGNGISDINSDDIETITVLRGANASALYGSRAANGVVLITTKKGRATTKGLGVSVTNSLEIGQVFDLPNYQNKYGGGATQKFSDYNGELIPDYTTDESWGPMLDGTLVRQYYSWFKDDPDYGKKTPWVAHPNNVKDFYQSAMNKKTSVSVSGRGETSQFRLSYTNLDQEGVVPNSSLSRNSISVSASDEISDKLTAGANFSYINTYTKGRPSFGSSGNGSEEGSGLDSPVRGMDQWFQRQVDLNRAKDYQTKYASNKSWNISSPTNLDAKFWDNPYFTLYNNYTEDWKNRVFGNVFAKYQITKNLSAEVNARTDFYTLRAEARIVKGSQGNLFNGGEYQESMRKFQENNYDALLRYEKDISESLSLTINAGANRRDFSSHKNGGITIGGLSVPTLFSLESSVDRPIIEDTTFKKRVNSVYSSVSLGYKDLLYLDGSYRSDWSSTLPSENNSYQYPSFNGSFIFSELIDSGLLNYGKLRAGWSKVGNDTDPYSLVGAFSAGVGYGNLPLYSVPNTLNNSNLKPEETYSKEIGVDLKILNNIDLGLTYYDSYTTNQIITLPVSSTSGYSSFIINAGRLSNSGVEATLGASPIRSQDGFNWDFSTNFAKNTSKVEELYKDELGNEINSVVINNNSSSVFITAEVGKPYGTFVVDGFERNEKGERLVDANGKYIRERGIKKGSYLPDWTGGFYNTFSYKGFSLSANIAVQKGGLIFSYTNRVGTRSGQFENTTGLNDKGNPVRNPVAEGGGVLAQGVDINGNPNTVYQDAKSYFKNLDDFYENFLYDASFIKLRDITLSYKLPRKWLDRTPLDNIAISIYGRNIATLHKNTPNIDPEVTYGSGNIQGIENSTTPATRYFGMNLNVKF